MYGCYPFVNLANSRLQLTWDLAGHSFAEFVGSVYYFVRFVKYFSTMVHSFRVVHFIKLHVFMF